MNEMSNKELLRDEINQVRTIITCPICLDILDKPVSTPCSHVFCADCMVKALAQKPACPLCSQKTTKKTIYSIAHLDHIIKLFYELIVAVDAEFASNQSSASANAIANSMEAAKPSAMAVIEPMQLKPVMEDNTSSSATLPPSPIIDFSHDVGALVHVLPRTWAGINKLGGVGRVEAAYKDEENDWHYTVKYVLDGNRDEGIPAAFVEKYVELGRQNRRAKLPLTPLSDRGSARKASRLSSSSDASSSLTDHTKRVFDGKENTSYSATSSYSSRKNVVEPPRNIVLLTTAIDSKYNIDQKLEAFAIMSTHVTLSCNFTAEATHLVVSTDRNNVMTQRTMKYMQALARGIWIVSTKWLEDSIQQGRILHEGDYEVRGNRKAYLEQAPRRARMAKSDSSNGSNGLLAGVHVLLFGSFPMPGPAKSHLEFLLTNCNATLHNNISTFLQSSSQHSSSHRLTKVAVCSSADWCDKADFQQALTTAQASTSSAASGTQDTPIVTAAWLMDCVTNFVPIPTDSYLLE